MADNPFAIEQKVYYQFKNDEYIDACIISYQQADLPPGPMAQNDSPVKSCRFLFAGYYRDDAGNQVFNTETGAPIIARKWTKWMRISDSKRASLMQLFDTSSNGFKNIFEIFMDCKDTNGKLWTTPFKILLEQSEKYQNIIRIKPGNNTDICAKVFYDEKYIPYRIVKAYGNLQELSIAACKFTSGVKTFSPEEMIEPDENAEK